MEDLGLDFVFGALFYFAFSHCYLALKQLFRLLQLTDLQTSLDNLRNLFFSFSRQHTYLRLQTLSFSNRLSPDSLQRPSQLHDSHVLIAFDLL